jgi:hypothetical protein
MAELFIEAIFYYVWKDTFVRAVGRFGILAKRASLKLTVTSGWLAKFLVRTHVLSIIGYCMVATWAIMHLKRAKCISCNFPRVFRASYNQQS